MTSKSGVVSIGRHRVSRTSARRNGSQRSLAAATVTVGLIVTAGHTAGPSWGSAGTGRTVLTLEGGLVGVQDLLRFTPLQLGGKLCAPPNRCEPVDYPALPGEEFNQDGADILAEAISASTAGGEPITLFGHSQGGQLIHVLLRRWADDPGSAPDPDLVSWVSIGNPENPMGGTARKPGFPSDTPYRGTEVIRQYDGWADWPSKPGNLLAMANAAVGALMAHPNYIKVDLDDPANVRYTPAGPDGSPGAVTYVWAPTPVLPIVAGAGLLAPELDRMLRPIVEAGYDRPVDLGTGDPGAGRRPDPRPRRTGVKPAALGRNVAPGSSRPGSAAATTAAAEVIAEVKDSAPAAISPERPSTQRPSLGPERRGSRGR